MRNIFTTQLLMSLRSLYVLLKSRGSLSQIFELSYAFLSKNEGHTVFLKSAHVIKIHIFAIILLPVTKNCKMRETWQV